MTFAKLRQKCVNGLKWDLNQWEALIFHTLLYISTFLVRILIRKYIKFCIVFWKKMDNKKKFPRPPDNMRLRQIPCLDVDKGDNRFLTNSLFFSLLLHMLFLTVYSILCDWQIITEYFWMWGQFLTFFIQECKITLGIIPAKKCPRKLDFSLFRFS